MKGALKLFGLLVVTAAILVGTTVWSSAQQSGGSTAALQSALNTLVTTLNTYVDGLEGLLGTSNTNTGSTATSTATTATQTTTTATNTGTIATNTGTIAGAVSGNEMQVDVLTSALPSGAATAANQTTIDGRIDGLEGQVGIVTETAPATDTASSGLNGRLQRVAQRLTSLIALLPSALVGGRLDVNVGAVGGAVPTGASTFDFDTGGGTVTREALGLMVPASGGPVALPGDATAGLKVDLGADNDVTVAELTTGCTPNSTISTAAVMEVEIKGSAGRLKMLNVTSLDATPVYVKLYNDTAANVDETDTPIQRYGVPAGSADIGGHAIPIPPEGIAFDAAITLRVVTGLADNSTGALSANEVLVSWCFK